MKILVTPEDELEGLPPAVRKKFFSNLEVFRLQQLRLAQIRHQDDLHYRPSAATGPTLLNLRPARPSTAGATSSSNQRFLKPRIFGHSSSSAHLQASFPAAQEDWWCFHTLPEKIQQSHFSEAERIFFQSCRTCCLLDAADEAVYKLEQRGKASNRQNLVQTQSSLSNPRLSMASSAASSDRPADSAIDIDDSLYDSFRWLDEDDDLDLTLGPSGYPVARGDILNGHHVPLTSSTSREKSSSEWYIQRSGAPAPNANGCQPRNSSPSSNLQFPVSGHIQRPSSARPSSARPSSAHPTHRNVSQHATHQSTSLIDPSAKYYQDPEARLKLRVYLASPQKFDEAIEFGFPSLENKENFRPEQRPRSRKHSTREDSRTFLEADSQSIGMGVSAEVDDKEGANQLHGKGRNTTNGSPSLDRRPQPLHPIHSLCALGRPREMTLKMTLTRPDLRATEPASSDHTQDMEDPLALAALPPADQDLRIWDSPSDERNMVRRMWRKFRRRRD